MSGEYTNLNRRLLDLSSETTAQAIILLRRKQLIASTGSLSSPALQELVELINSFSRISVQYPDKHPSFNHSRTGIGDLVRFIQLKTTQSKHFLYVVSLSRELQLAMVFDQGTRFSIVRKQTQSLRRALLAPERPAPLEYRASGSERFDAPLSSPTVASASTPSTPPKAQAAPSLETQESHQQPSGSDIPTPPEKKYSETEKEDTQVTSLKPPDIGPKGSVDATQAPSAVGAKEASDYHAMIETEGQSQGKVETSTFTVEQADQSTSEIALNSYIAYSCLLIPRMPQHLLTSNLASYLFKWMGQLCLAYGWRLEHLSIHSGHIQWVAGAPLTTSPAFLVRTLRQRTSNYIFKQFQILTNDNPSGDFWAPGFYILGGKQSFQPQQIDKFIEEIREQQGVYNSNLYE
jgi:REP element-mobilizing transposase RayT